MIVDDEILVRVGLKSTVDWASMGFIIVAEASNGEQAYEMFLNHNPDVILTDIKMPKMDGLRLTELVKAKKPKVKVVILTCYDDFTYAREALKLGASNYILKSEIEDEELINLMNNIRTELDVEIGNVERNSILQHQINSNLDVLKEKLLNDLIDSKVRPDNDFKIRSENLNLSIRDKSFFLAILFKENVEDFITYTERDWHLLDSGVINIASEILREKGFKFLINLKANSFILLIIKEDGMVEEIYTTMGRIRDSIQKYLNISTSVILSNEFDDFFQTGYIYKECEKKSQMMFYKESGSLIISNGMVLNEINCVECRETFRKEILESIDEEDLQKSYKLLASLENAFIEKHIKPIQVKLFYISLIDDISGKYGLGDIEEYEINDFSNFNNLVLNSKRISDITRILKVLIGGVIDFVKMNRIKNTKNIVQQAINYIGKNYDKKISLESLAVHINLSKQYLCYIFKRETGENVSIYINKLRVEKSKELIKKYDYKVKELYDKVGFSDQQYFCKTFKKITGMTIAKYKEDISKKIHL